MSFYPHVNRGDAFKPNALLENDVRDLVNRLKNSGMPKRIGCAASAFYVQVWNVEDGKLPAGAAVSILVDTDLPVVDGALPCRNFTGDYRVFGVLKTELAPGDIGDCVIDGMVEVPITGSAYPGARALPVISDGSESLMPKFGVTPVGGARVLGITEDGNAVLDLGGDDDYFGLFKVALTYMSGYEGGYSEDSRDHGSSSRQESSSEESDGSSESSFGGSSEDSSESSFDSPGLDDSSSGGGSGGGGSGGGGSNGGSSNGSGSGGGGSSIDSIEESGFDDSHPDGPGHWEIASCEVTLTEMEVTGRDRHTWEGALNGAVTVSLVDGEWIETPEGDAPYAPNVSCTISETGFITLTVGASGRSFHASGYGRVRISENWEDGAPDPADEDPNFPDEIYTAYQWTKLTLSGSATSVFIPDSGSSGGSGSSSGGDSDSVGSSDGGGEDGSSGNGSGDGYSDEPHDESSERSSDGSIEDPESSESFSGGSSESSPGESVESSEDSSAETESSGNSSGSHGHSHGGFVDDGELVLAVFDGADPEAEDCGFADCSDDRIHYPRTVFTNWRRKRNLYVYVSDDQIVLSEEYPEPDSEVLRRLLARLIYKNGVYAVVQEQHGPIYEFVCDCSEGGDGSGSGSSGNHGGGSGGGSESGSGYSYSGSESGGSGSSSSDDIGSSVSRSGGSRSSSHGGSHSASRSKSRSGSNSGSESSSGYEESGFDSSWIQDSSESSSMGSKSGSSSTSWFSSGLIVDPSGETPSSRTPGIWNITGCSITFTKQDVTGRDRHTYEGGLDGSVTVSKVNGEWRTTYSGDHLDAPDYQVSVNERGYITVQILAQGHPYSVSGYGRVNISDAWEPGAPDPADEDPDYPDEIYTAYQWNKCTLSGYVTATREGDVSVSGN